MYYFGLDNFGSVSIKSIERIDKILVGEMLQNK